MRGLALSCIATLLAASPSSGAQGAWSSAELMSAPVIRYDGDNFGVIIGCDNQFTYKITLISDPLTLGSLASQDQQLVLLVDGREIVRKAAWLADPVDGLVAYEMFLPAGKMPELAGGGRSASFTIGDLFSGEAISFDTTLSAFAQQSAPLVAHCSALE